MDWDRMAWNSGYRTCSECNRRYHLSGTEECDCIMCINEWCGNTVDGEHGDECEDCQEALEDVTEAIVKAQCVALGGE